MLNVLNVGAHFHLNISHSIYVPRVCSSSHQAEGNSTHASLAYCLKDRFTPEAFEEITMSSISFQTTCTEILRLTRVFSFA